MTENENFPPMELTLRDLLVEAMDEELRGQPHELGNPISEDRQGDPPECRVCGGPWPCLTVRVNRVLNRV